MSRSNAEERGMRRAISNSKFCELSLSRLWAMEIRTEGIWGSQRHIESCISSLWISNAATSRVIYWIDLMDLYQTNLTFTLGSTIPGIALILENKICAFYDCLCDSHTANDNKINSNFSAIQNGKWFCDCLLSILWFIDYFHLVLNYKEIQCRCKIL